MSAQNENASLVSIKEKHKADGVRLLLPML